MSAPHLSALPILQISPKASDNIANNFMTFNKDVGNVIYTYPEGAGSAVNVYNKMYAGTGSLLLTSGDDDADFYAFPPNILSKFTATETKRHIVQFELSNPATGVTSGDLMSLGITKNDAEFMEIYVDASQMNGSTDTWQGFFKDFPLEIGDELDFYWILPANNNYPVGGAHAVRFDGFKIEVDNRELPTPSAYSEPEIQFRPLPTGAGQYIVEIDGDGYQSWKKILAVTTSLNFPETAANSSSYLDVGLTAAVPGQTVQLGLPIDVLSMLAANCNFVPLVLSPGVIRLYFQNNTAGALNPAVGDFTFKIVT